ncbi:MFS general substrate transporter [Macrolepiota fuliginosa MF-IS2]|uniref:MFS general substrate transporter n=1 Tax=Macrolepiota fuliginosa MF-IS2 TaxID=1400762 RepID=A0A9P5XI68_9AGAR|nr:MFS general substrate transporter [Macrolepiota fuliginosa MF-IS2]
MSLEKKVDITENASVGSSNLRKDGWLEHSEAERKRVLRKMDFHLLPFISLLYLLSFLDRANIGNARIAGMATDVGLTGLRYNVIAAVFFIPYALAEVPSNICLKLFRPSRWIPSIMVAWGLVMTLMSLCHTYQGLIVARVFLGLTEAGLFPGITFYLSLWYRRGDVASRIAIFFSAATIAGAFGGLLAYGIERMEGVGGLHGWQWIFCLEGIVTVLVAFLGYFIMHDYPETAHFLTPSERQIVIAMLKEDQQGQATHYDFKFVLQAMGDYKTFVQVGIYIGLLIPVYATALFTPTIVNQLGYSAANAQLLSVPPFVAGCIITILFGLSSDRFNRRGPFIISGCIVSLIGYIILYTQTRPGVSYGGAVLAAVGVYPTIAIALAWAGSAAGGDIRKGVTLAMVIGIGNLGGVCSSFIYLKPPRFHVGHGTCMGFLGLAIVMSLFAMWDYNRLNKQKIVLCEREGIDESRQGEFAEMGNDSPLFRYTL